MTRLELSHYQPGDIVALTVYKDTSAIRLIGTQGAAGVVYMFTEAFVKNKMWNLLKNKSADYGRIVPSPDADSAVVYILNRKVLTKNVAGELSGVTDQTLRQVEIISPTDLLKDYSVRDKMWGVVIQADLPAAGQP